MYCSKCGKENEDGSLFCSECGKNLHITSHAKVIINKAIPLVNSLINNGIRFIKKKTCFFEKIPKKLIVAIATAIVLVITLCITIFHKSDENKIIELTNELAYSINIGDYEKMISCFEPSAQNQTNALLNVGSSLLGSLSSLLGSIDLKDMWTLGAVGMSANEEVYICIYDITINKDTATADISFSFDEGKSDAIGTVGLIKIKGDWYFKNF